MRRSLAVAFTGVALAAAIGLTVWIVADDARRGYLETEPRVAVEPDAGGWATIGESSVRLAAFAPERSVTTDDGETWLAPDGYTAWRLEIEVESTMDELDSCTPRVVDAAGRTFTPIDPDAVGYPDLNIATLDCGLQDDPRLEVLFVLPDDAEPARVELVDAVGWGFSPAFYRFPLAGT